ncbi:hypothetical protein D3C87_1619240 [compost metagenome]
MFVLYRIVEQVAENLLHGEPVSQKTTGCAHGDAYLAAGIADLVMNACGRRLQHFAEIDAFRFQLAAAIARNLQDGVDQGIHLLGR